MAPEPLKVPIRKKRNFVQEQSKIKVSKTAAKREFIPGTYSQHHPSECPHQLRQRPIHLKLEKATDGKEIYQLVGAENVRDLIIPAGEINVYPAIWEKGELNRLKNRAKIVTAEDRAEQLALREAERERLIAESAERKRKFKELEKNKANEKKGNESLRNSDDGVILDKAFLAKQEQEEEIKIANRVILTTKCQVIRDAQIAEKNMIERELRDENIRLEKMMNEDRESALKKEDRKRDELKKINERHALEIKNQLREREMSKVLEAERIEEEAKAMGKAQIAITLDMMEREKERKEKTAKVRNELQKANELSEFFKRLQFEEQRIADLKVQEYMKQRQERQKQLAHKKKIAKEQQEREKERLLQLQQRLMESRSAQTDMSMRREQEEKEREFRKKEKEAALKRRENEKALIDARSAQLEEVKRARAIQIAREESEFQRTCHKLKSEEERENRVAAARIMERDRYRNEIIKQMNEREMVRRELGRKAKNEFNANLEAERNRQKNVQSSILSKIQDMRNNKVPEKFIKDVERQLKISIH